MVPVRLICPAVSVHIYESLSATVACGGALIKTKGRTVLENCWKEIDRLFLATLKSKQEDETEEKVVSLPEIKEGRIFQHVTATIKEGKTTLHRRYTKDTLLSAMETPGAENIPGDAKGKGLGTPATHASIIEKLIKLEFVERQNKSLIPTSKGIDLITRFNEVASNDWRVGTDAETCRTERA